MTKAWKWKRFRQCLLVNPEIVTVEAQLHLLLL